MKPSMKLAMLAASAIAINPNPLSYVPRRNRRVDEDSEALKSANAKINRVRQDRRVWLLKEREVRSLNFRESRELERNIYAD